MRFVSASMENVHLMCVGLLPTTVFLFSSFTYDAFVIALLIVGHSIVCNRVLSEEKIQNKTDDGIYSCYGCGMLFKGGLYSIFWHYIGLCRRTSFIAGDKRICLKQEFFVLLILMFASFILPLIGNVTSGAR